MKTIEQQNAMIAEFMGAKWINEPYKAKKDDTELTDFWHWSKPDNGYPYNMCMNPPTSMSTAYMMGNFLYHTSWDWLMPVVEKIEVLEVPIPEKYKRGFLKDATHGAIIFDTSFDCREKFIGWHSAVSIELSNPFIFDSLNTETPKYKTKIEATYNAVCQFIEWYNANK